MVILRLFTLDGVNGEGGLLIDFEIFGPSCKNARFRKLPIEGFPGFLLPELFRDLLMLLSLDEFDLLILWDAFVFELCDGGVSCLEEDLSIFEFEFLKIPRVGLSIQAVFNHGGVRIVFRSACNISWAAYLRISRTSRLGNHNFSGLKSLYCSFRSFCAHGERNALHATLKIAMVVILPG
jgi:hypothetical protein